MPLLSNIASFSSTTAHLVHLLPEAFVASSGFSSSANKSIILNEPERKYAEKTFLFQEFQTRGTIFPGNLATPK